MDPDETLKTLRDLCARAALEAETSDDLSDELLEMIEAFNALDTWLSRGGFLPGAWKRK